MNEPERNALADEVKQALLDPYRSHYKVTVKPSLLERVESALRSGEAGKQERPARCLAHPKKDGSGRWGCQWCDQSWASEDDIACPNAPEPSPAAREQRKGEAGDWIDAVALDIAELPDRNSPDDAPEQMLVTAKELRAIIENNLPAALTAERAPGAERPVAWQYREKLREQESWSMWRTVGHEPQGRNNEDFEKRPLFLAAPQPDLADGKERE